jgi:hypothetical protein
VHRRARAACRPSGPGAGVSKGDSEKRSPAAKRDYIRDHRPCGLSIAKGCKPMGIARSTYYAMPAARAGDAELLAAITWSATSSRPMAGAAARHIYEVSTREWSLLQLNLTF